MRLNGLIFDLGNVLIHNHPERAAEKFSRCNGRSTEDNIRIMGDHPDYMCGKITPQEFARQSFQEFGITGMSEEQFHAIYVDIFDLNEPLVHLLEGLVKKDGVLLEERINLAMLSNTEETTIKFLRGRFPRLFAVFGDRLALSYEMRHKKLDHYVYERALELAKTKPENTAYIDDKIEYVEAARKLGMHGIQYFTFESLVQSLKALQVPIHV